MKGFKKIKNKLKNNKILLILSLILIVCFVLILFSLVKYFYGGLNSSKYGDRLDGINEYKLDTNINKQIEKLYTDEEIDSVVVKLDGKIIYLTLNLSNIISKEDAKSLALKALDEFSDEEKQFYDIQFIITCEKEEKSSTEENLYPIMGYKNTSSSVVVWIKD